MKQSSQTEANALAYLGHASFDKENILNNIDTSGLFNNTFQQPKLIPYCSKLECLSHSFPLQSNISWQDWSLPEWSPFRDFALRVVHCFACKYQVGCDRQCKTLQLISPLWGLTLRVCSWPCLQILHWVEVTDMPNILAYCPQSKVLYWAILYNFVLGLTHEHQTWVDVTDSAKHYSLQP